MHFFASRRKDTQFTGVAATFGLSFFKRPARAQRWRRRGKRRGALRWVRRPAAWTAVGAPSPIEAKRIRGAERHEMIEARLLERAFPGVSFRVTIQYLSAQVVEPGPSRRADILVHARRNWPAWARQNLTQANFVIGAVAIRQKSWGSFFARRDESRGWGRGNGGRRARGDWGMGTGERDCGSGGTAGPGALGMGNWGVGGFGLTRRCHIGVTGRGG